MATYFLLLNLTLLITFDGNPCGKYRNLKHSNALFQDVRTLILNCDKTFSYRQTNCVHPNTSSGTWNVNGSTIWLYTSKKVQRLAAKEYKSIEGFLYIDLSKQEIALKESFLIWKRSDTWIDTL